MNEEEKKSIELLENIRNNSWTTKYIMSSDSKNAEVLLNLIEKLQKENKELKEELKEENELNKIIKDTKLDELFCRRNGKKVEQAIKLRDELLKLSECKLYGIKKCKKSVILITKEEVIPVQKIKDKIEEIQNIANELSQEIEEELKSEDICQEYIRDKRRERGLANRDIKLLQELLEGK